MTKTDKETRIDEIKESQRRRRSRARRRNLLIGFVSLLICVITLLIVVSLLLGRHAPTRYAFLYEGQVWHSHAYKAVLLQAGETIEAPIDGIFVPLVSPGERVAKDEIIGMMVPESVRDDVDQALDLRAVLVRHQLSDHVIGADRLAEAYRTSTRAQLESYFRDLRRSVSTGDTLDLTRTATAVEALLKPNTLDTPRGLSHIADAAADMQAYKEALTRLISTSQALQSSSSGIVDYRIGPDALIAGTDTPLDQLARSLFESNLVKDIPVLTMRQQGETVATLLTSTSAKVAVYLPDRHVSEIDENQSFGVRLQGEDDFVAVRFDTVQAVENGVIGRFLLPTQQADWRLNQQISIESRLSVTTGLEVPLTCLLEYDSADGIAILMKVSDGQIKRVPVFVKESDGRNAIIEGRRGDPLGPEQFDLYVLNPVANLEGTYID